MVTRSVDMEISLVNGYHDDFRDCPGEPYITLLTETLFEMAKNIRFSGISLKGLPYFLGQNNIFLIVNPYLNTL